MCDYEHNENEEIRKKRNRERGVEKEGKEERGGILWPRGPGLAFPEWPSEQRSQGEE